MGNELMPCRCLRAVDPPPVGSTTPPIRSSPPEDRWADNGNNSDPECADMPLAVYSDDSDCEVDSVLRPGTGTVLRPPIMKTMDVEMPKAQEPILHPESVHQMMRVTRTVADCSPAFCIGTSGMGKTYYLKSLVPGSRHSHEDVFLAEDMDRLLGKAPPHWSTDRSIVCSETRRWYIREGVQHALNLIPGMGGWELWQAAMMRRSLMVRQKNHMVGCVMAGLFHSNQPELMVKVLRTYFLAQDDPHGGGEYALETVPPFDDADNDLPPVYKIPQRQIVCMVPTWALYQHRQNLRNTGPDGGGREGRKICPDHAWNGLLCMRALVEAFPDIWGLDDFNELTPLLLRRRAGHIGAPNVYVESQARASRAIQLNPRDAARTLYLERHPWVVKAPPPTAPPPQLPKPPPPIPEVEMLPSEPAGSSRDTARGGDQDVHVSGFSDDDQQDDASLAASLMRARNNISR